MAIAVISAWLSGKTRNYDQGVLLYRQYGDSVVIKALLAGGKSAYHQNRLAKALEELNAKISPEVKPAPLVIPSITSMPLPVKRYAVSDEAWNKLPEPIKDLYGENTQLHSRSFLLFNQLPVCADDEQRRLKCVQILDDRDRINDNWKAIKDFNETGKIHEQLVEQETKSVDAMSIAELSTQANNLATYLSKDRKKLILMEAGPKKNKVLHRIAEREVQLELIKKRLADA
ncbi:MAG: hypothetical protein EOP45_03090 [Sphingobacteriaceae bacterium]|nr:MAG: hypothetical protein EOP45_03090 [Sphingobacteriaceae bacterium]